MKKRSMPRTAMISVDQAMKVLIGVNPAVVLRWKRSRQIERRQDHVERRHGEPSEPIGPGGEAVDVLGEPWPAVLEGRIGEGRRPAGALGHHGGQLSQNEAEQPARQGDEDRDRNRRGAELCHHDRGDTGHQDRAGEADHEGAPPSRLTFEVSRSVFQLLRSSRLLRFCHDKPPRRDARSSRPFSAQFTLSGKKVSCQSNL